MKLNADGKSFWLDFEEFSKQQDFVKQKERAMLGKLYSIGIDPYNDVNLDMDKDIKGPKLKLDINKKET